MKPKKCSLLVLVVIAFGLSVAACSPDDAGRSSSKPALAPEMLVKPVEGQFLAGCRTEELLNELLMHSIQHEKTKFEGMFRNFDCVQIPTDGSFKLLTVRRAVVEFTPATSQKSDGMWAPIEAFQPAR